jgi:hypothetical protein
LLAFTSVYFYESGLFNGLRARKLKKFPAFLNSTPRVAARPRRFGLSSIANTPLAGRLAPASAILILRKIVAVISVFVKPFLSTAISIATDTTPHDRAFLTALCSQHWRPYRN